MLHLSESELQQYVLERHHTQPHISAHIQLCELCRSKAISYDLLFKRLTEIPRPVFDFNVSELVLEQLPVQKTSFPWMIMMAVSLATLLISATVFCFTIFLPDLFNGLSINLFYLVLIPSVSALSIQSMILLKEHKKQMHTLNFR